MTPFEEVKKKIADGIVKPPLISMAGKQIDPVRYQLNVHKFYLGLMVRGITNKQVSFTDIKKFYGLKGRSAKDILPGFMIIYNENVQP